MKFAIIHFNTPELTQCLCSSIRKFHNDAHIVLFDNSTIRKFDNCDMFVDEYIDNTASQLIDFDTEFSKCEIDEAVQRLNNCGSARHCRTVQWLFDNFTDNEFVLLDSDVLLTRPLDFFDNTVACSATYEIFPNMKNRFLPFVTFFNLRTLKEHNIKYFDATRMNGLSKIGEKYDTGASFLEDVITNKLPYHNINYMQYLVHFRNGSWSNKNFKSWLMTYKHLWM